MSFTTWASAFVDGVDTISAAFLNQIRVDVGRAVDGNAGGTYTPSGTLAINGAAGGGFSSDNCTGLTMYVSGSSTPGIVWLNTAGNRPAVNGKKELESFSSSGTALTRLYAHNVTADGYGFSYTVNADWDEAGRQYAKDVSGATASEFVFTSDGVATLRARATAGTPFAESAWEEQIVINSAGILAGATPTADTLYPTNIPKAWAVIEVEGGGAVTVHDEFNVGTASRSTSTITIPLRTNFANSNYAVLITNMGTSAHQFIHSVRFITQTTSSCSVQFYDNTNTLIDLSIASGDVKFAVAMFGRQ